MEKQFAIGYEEFPNNIDYVESNFQFQKKKYGLEKGK